MSRSEKIMEDIQDQLRHWSKKTGKEYPHQLESTLRNALSHLDPATIAWASEQALSTLTGNTKTARKVLKNVERSLETARPRVGGKQPRRSRAWLLCAAAALTACFVAAWAWMAARRSKAVAAASTKGSVTGPQQSGTQTDPDMSNS